MSFIISQKDLAQSTDDQVEPIPVIDEIVTVAPETLKAGQETYRQVRELFIQEEDNSLNMSEKEFSKFTDQEFWPFFKKIPGGFILPYTMIRARREFTGRGHALDEIIMNDVLTEAIPDSLPFVFNDALLIEGTKEVVDSLGEQGPAQEWLKDTFRSRFIRDLLEDTDEINKLQLIQKAPASLLNSVIGSLHLPTLSDTQLEAFSLLTQRQWIQLALETGVTVSDGEVRWESENLKTLLDRIPPDEQKAITDWILNAQIIRIS